MEQGYEDTRFEKTVDRHLHCPICLNVLRDPVQCRRNQHYFCTSCITKHLQENSQTCPTCMEELTVETLNRPARILTDLLSTFKISCDYTERGCREIVVLGALKRHVAGCGLGPVMCSNDECLQVVNKRDKELHETKMCDFRTVKCDYCDEELQFVKIKSHKCPTRKEIDEMKLDLSEVKDKLNNLCCAQDEMAKDCKEMRSEMRSMMSDLKESITNSIKQAMATTLNSCHVSSLHPANTNEDIVIAGGGNSSLEKLKSFEIFSWANNSWTFVGEMNQCRSAATSLVYENHMIVTGGFSNDGAKDSVERLDLDEKNAEWIYSPVTLPYKCRGHKTVLDHNRLLVIGGMDDKNVSKDTIYEILLTHPYSSKLLTCMPLPINFHGAERICDRVYILGGRTSSGQITNAVLMYDLVTNRCQKMAPLPFATWIMATVCWEDNVILLGGENEKRKALDTVTMYNVNTGKSTMLPKMKQKRRECAAVVTGNKIVVMGGRDERGVHLHSVECYSLDTKVWEVLPPMVESRLNPTAVVKPACIYKG